MNRQQSLLAARGVTDGENRLVTADEPLAALHRSCGGSVPGVLAVPELLDLVRQARAMDLRIAREFSAFDGEEVVSGFVRIHPIEGEDGCELLIENWQRIPQMPENTHDLAERLDAVDRAAAEVTARLNARQQMQFLSTSAPDAADLHDRVASGPGRVWTNYVTLHGLSHEQPLHWRLLDGVQCSFTGSERDWRARLVPIGPAASAPRGFELLLISDVSLAPATDSAGDVLESAPPPTRMIGSSLTPVLRPPIARIIANAETIRTRLAGPLRAEYCDYAGNIAAAGQHLSAMLDDLADLEVVEAPGFTAAREEVDVIDVAHRAAGILGVRAQHRQIKINLPEKSGPDQGTAVIAAAEFRRVLQILINLIGNAIAYSPEGSTVTVTAERGEGDQTVELNVRDQGAGVSADQAERIFDKFERLGRDNGGGDAGSGLGLYISRKLALAMEGDLAVDCAEGDRRGGQQGGALFTLTLPRWQEDG